MEWARFFARATGHSSPTAEEVIRKLRKFNTNLLALYTTHEMSLKFSVRLACLSCLENYQGAVRAWEVQYSINAKDFCGRIEHDAILPDMTSTLNIPTSKYWLGRG